MIHGTLARGSSHSVVSLPSTEPQGRSFIDSTVEHLGCQKTQAGVKSATQFSQAGPAACSSDVNL